MARFDVINNAAETNFTMEKIIIENVKLQGHAFGDATGIPAPELPTGTLPMIAYSEETNANTDAPIESLFYLYPTEIGVGKSAISFEGTLMNERRIYTLKSDQAIEANKRYTLKIKKIEKDELELDITVEDWADDGGTHEAEPETDDMIVGTATVSGAGVRLTGKTCDASDATATGTLTIPVTTFNNTGTRVDITYLPGTGNRTDRITVTSPEPVLTYATGYLQKHQINIPVQKSPFRALIEIVNNSKPEERDTFYVNSIPNYDITQAKPVLVGGIYWAPVNAGASEVGTTTEVKHHGLLYQWGRNKGFAYADGIAGNISDTIQGPLDWDTAMGSAKDKFIKGSGTFKTWLTPFTEDLWSGDNRQGPCPDGWRVPTEEELTVLSNIYNDGGYSETGRMIWNATDKRVEITSDNGDDVLYLPTTGYRYYSSGESKDRGAKAFSWASNVIVDTDILGKKIELSSNKIFMGITINATAYPVRCVQD